VTASHSFIRRPWPGSKKLGDAILRQLHDEVAARAHHREASLEHTTATLDARARRTPNSGVKLYTKTGDDGTTGLFGGARVKKASLRVEAYGTVDETNAAIGVARAAKLDEQTDAVLAQVQVDLFTLGAELACVPGKEAKMSMKLLDAGDSERLEKAIDAAEEGLPPLKTFVLPGGSAQAAYLHLARTICRRAERAVLALDDTSPRSEIVIYLNRLSDLLFVLARKANSTLGVQDVPWTPRA
jgi:cob(I)alamin adenosyltransferase